MLCPHTKACLYTGPSVYPNAIVLPVLASLSFLATLPPLILNIKARNIAVCILISSITLLNLQNIINPPIWPNDDKFQWHSGNIICDIETKLQLGLTTSIPAAATCVCRNLATVLSPNRQSITSSPSTHKRRLAFDLILSIALPVFIMSTHILVQPARYYIYGISGCQYVLDRSWLSLLLVQTWPVLLFTTCAVYAGLIISRLIRHRRQTSALLANAQVSRARFVRVFGLALAVLVLYGPITVGAYVVSRQGGTWRWEWRNVHPPYWERLVLMKSCDGKVWYDRWAQVASGFVLFALFGTGRDAAEMYARWVKRTGITRFYKIARNRFGFRGSRGGTDLSRAVYAEGQLVGGGVRDGTGDSIVDLGRLNSHAEASNANKTTCPQLSSELLELEG